MGYKKMKSKYDKVIDDQNTRYKIMVNHRKASLLIGYIGERIDSLDGIFGCIEEKERSSHRVEILKMSKKRLKERFNEI